MNGVDKSSRGLENILIFKHFLIYFIRGHLFDQQQIRILNSLRSLKYLIAFIVDESVVDFTLPYFINKLGFFEILCEVSNLFLEFSFTILSLKQLLLEMDKLLSQVVINEIHLISHFLKLLVYSVFDVLGNLHREFLDDSLLNQHPISLLLKLQTLFF